MGRTTAGALLALACCLVQPQSPRSDKAITVNLSVGMTVRRPAFRSQDRGAPRDEYPIWTSCPCTPGIYLRTRARTRLFEFTRRFLQHVLPKGLHRVQDRGAVECTGVSRRASVRCWRREQPRGSHPPRRERRRTATRGADARPRHDQTEKNPELAERSGTFNATSLGSVR